MISFQTVRSHIMRNGRVRLLALILAVITYAAVRQVTSEVRDIKVPVVVDVADGISVLGQDVSTVTLTCRGAHDDLQALASRALRAVVRPDPEEVPGRSVVTVGRRNIEGRLRGVSLLRVEPSHFFVTFDRQLSQEVVVVPPRLDGYPSVGRAEVEFEPVTVMASGPASLVEPIRLLVPESISVAGRADSFTVTRSLQLDESAHGVVLDPPDILVRVRVVTDQVSRSWTNVPIRVLSDPGARPVGSGVPMQSRVTINGSEAVLGGLQVSDFRLMADCSGAGTGAVHEASLVLHLPRGVTAGSSVDPATVKVYFEEAE